MSLKELLADWPDAPLTACKGCGKKILFATTQEGKQVPLDVGPPTYLLMRFGGEVDPKEWKYRCDKEKRTFVNHFVTCPKASQF
jgi:hypothetical protein